MEKIVESIITDQLNEINTGSIDSIKHALEGKSKLGKEALASAKRKYNKGDYKGAKADIDDAIDALKDARSEAEEIDDDGILENLLIAAIMSIVPVFGSLAYTVGMFYSWYTLRKQSDKGDAYSNRHPNRQKNFVLEFLFGKLRGAGYSRSMLLSGYDKLIGECQKLKKLIDKHS